MLKFGSGAALPTFYASKKVCRIAEQSGPLRGAECQRSLQIVRRTVGASPLGGPRRDKTLTASAGLNVLEKFTYGSIAATAATVAKSPDTRTGKLVLGRAVSRVVSAICLTRPERECKAFLLARPGVI